MKSLLVLIGVVLVCGVTGCSEDDPHPPPLPLTQTRIVRGKELVTGFASCGFCHAKGGKITSPLSGGREVSDEYGEVTAPNITFSESGLNSWNQNDILHLFRSQLTPDDSVVSSRLHGGYEWLADSDISAITGYIRSLPAVNNEIERRSVSFLARNTTGFFKARRQVSGYVPEILPRFKGAVGQYLADQVANCGSCHNSPSELLSSVAEWGGGSEITIDGETKIAPNITSSKTSGIGMWSESDIQRYFRTGSTPTGKNIDPRFCPVEFYKQAPPSDIEAVALYVKSIFPIDVE